MGNTFTSVCLRTSKTAAKKALLAAMQARGFRADKKNPEFYLTLQPCGRKWCCLKGELMDLGEPEDFAASLEEQLGVPMLTASCVDSDFIYLTLHRNGESDAACIGIPYDEEKPLPQREFWQDLVKDWDAFDNLLSRDWLFAEDALVPLGKLMGFDGRIMLPSDETEGKVITIGFSHAEENGSPLVSSGPTKLNFQRGQVPKPYRLFDNSNVCMHNYGGPSRGLEILIELSFPDNLNHECEITNAMLLTGAQQCRRKQAVDLKPIPSRDGFERWHAVLPDFEIPDGLNLSYRYPENAWKRKMETEFAQEICFVYRLHASEHLKKLNIRFTPMEYPDGSYTWHLEDCYDTAQEWEVFHYEGIAAYREIDKKKRESGILPNIPVPYYPLEKQAKSDVP